MITKSKSTFSLSANNYLYRRMPFQFDVYTSLQALASEVKFPDKYDLDTDINEAAKLDNIQNYYLVIRDHDRRLAVIYYQLLSVKPYHFNISDRFIQQCALSAALRIVRPTLLVSGNLFRHDQLFHCFVEDQLTAEAKRRMYCEATEYMIQYTNCSGIFMKDVEEDIAQEIMKDSSFIRMPDDISMEMHLPATWKQFADYEQALKHKYVQRLRKIKQAFKEVEVRAFDINDVTRYASEIHQLYMMVSRKQMVSMGILNPDFFVEMKKKKGDQYKVFGFFYEDRLVAFASAIVHDGEYDMNYIGFNYDYNQQLSLYFNILFHCVDMALQHGCSKLILGRTAIEAKAIMGCTPDYRYSFYKLRNVVVNWFYKMVAQYFSEQQGEAWKDRHPFKSEYYLHQPKQSPS